jgi:uncharacterized protein
LKLILILVAVAIAYWIIRSYKKKLDKSGRRRSAPAGEDMVRCAQCGLHLPRSEGVASGDHFYCSPDHRRLHQSHSSK